MTPSERLGWTFRDRRTLTQPFTEPPPVLGQVPADVVTAADAARGKLTGQVVRTVLAGLAVAGVFGCCAGLGGLIRDSSVPVTFGLLAVVMLLATAGVVTLVVMRHQSVVSRPQRLAEELHHSHTHATAGWQARGAAFEAAQLQQLAGVPEWGAARPAPGLRRLDVVGGNLWGWEALLTVFGASMLATHGPVTVVDLSGEAVCRELVRLTAGRGLTVDVQLLPTDLADSDLLAGLDGRQLVDVLVESMHGETETGSRADRSMDDRILTTVVAALGDDLSIGRVAAALRVLMDEPGDTPQLGAEERTRLGEELFSDAYRQRAHDQLRRMESYLHPLAELGTHTEPRAVADLTCLALATDGRSARTELLTDLIVQWLTRQVANHPNRTRTLIIAGADDLARRHVERLSDLCDRRGIRLALLYRHLRDTSLQVLGGGSVAFMHLGNHEEATRAADFIGREHTFVLSQLTRTLGGSDTHTDARTDGEATSEGSSVTTGLSGDITGLLRAARGWSRGEARNWNVTRSWNTTRSRAQGSSWSDTTGVQRVYEYAVEPRILQDLPDYAMLVVDSTPCGPQLRAVECNPDLVTIDGVSMEPLTDLVIPAARQPAVPPYAQLGPVHPSAYPASGPPVQRAPVRQPWGGSPPTGPR